ncbi:hybrid sensor histidine kinase/response regulator [Paraburkholderia silvatlantica]|uniref:histidine kinase n=1 Tax=Paraburkholderia silvatlantica TaxID=321895 RepID=A0ABR6FVT7_9BURK|nr:hybrid sensor histidine kinase/response regulator [Paraburkholderia silvatlantica]MBB2931138.1 two-component system sensor histidine kinase and response regulator WspE [Paraburkholderia silvatlantica]PVY28702.1 two-component system sensor histidine kinase and response regulator WspE [Paraburkholderia silvatlantica]PXW36339.1 two-component system sensor histidine kinase and response regulator WspE [Paraburkholderia silvatlantica]
MSDDELSRRSLLDLFHEEAAAQTRTLSAGLLALESAPADAATLEACMRATHSLKGAARIVGLPEAVEVASAMEDCFVAAQRGELHIDAARIDALLVGIDLLTAAGDATAAPLAHEAVEAFVARLKGGAQPDSAVSAPGTDELAALAASLRLPEPQREAVTSDGVEPAPSAQPPQPRSADAGRVLRVRAGTLDRLLGFAGEALVESRRIRPFAQGLLRTRRAQGDVLAALGQFQERHGDALDVDARAALADIRNAVASLDRQLSERFDDLDRIDRRGTQLAQRLYDEALQCRMRPFGDAAHTYPRVVRDLARSLGKRVRFTIAGESTQVDRDILEMLDAPLGHLLRNALDHGIEDPETRRRAGKPEEASLTLEARHSAGKLLIAVADDGAGIDLDALRASIVARSLAQPQAVAAMSDAELFDFLLLPGFSLRDTVTDVSGRGVGLDAVQNFAKAVRGTVRIESAAGQGTRFVLQLPLTLSVVRSLIVEVAGEAYAFPLAHVRRALSVPRSTIEMLEGQQHIAFEGRPVGLVTARQLLGAGAEAMTAEDLNVVLVGSEAGLYGVAVDRFAGERTLAVQPLDARLGRVRNVSAAALLDDGEIALIVDVEDIVTSVGRLVREGQLTGVARGGAHDGASARKRILIVEDSLTVRELERKLLEKRGYDVTVAVDGMDGWSTLRNAHFDLVITDVDMPRMDGIELVTMIKGDAMHRNVPVMIVSYKDREDDRRRGLDAGADYYLTKGSFHDEALLDAVNDLIGEATG